MTKELTWLAAPSVQVAASPLWHPEENVLYYTDVGTCKLYRYSPETKETTVALDDGRPIGAMTLQEDGSLLLFRDSANIVVYKDSEIAATIINAIGDYKQTYFSAAAADSTGRVVCSVISDTKHTGRLLMLDTNGRLEFAEDGFGVPAGLAFSPNGDALYFSDSHRTHLTTWRYNYDTASTTPLKQGRSLFHACFDDGNAWPGAPAGIAPMEDGTLWIARRDGAMIVHHDNDGMLAENLHIHVRKPIGLCFGGDNLCDLYITTSSAHRKPIEGLHAGDIAVIHSVGKGAIPFRSKVGL